LRKSRAASWASDSPPARGRCGRSAHPHVRRRRRSPPRSHPGRSSAVSAHQTASSCLCLPPSANAPAEWAGHHSATWRSRGCRWRHPPAQPDGPHTSSPASRFPPGSRPCGRWPRSRRPDFGQRTVSQRSPASWFLFLLSCNQAVSCRWQNPTQGCPKR